MNTEPVGPEGGLVRKTSYSTLVRPVYSGKLTTAVQCAYKTGEGCDTPFSN
jgi:hypothetical protein